MGGFFQTDRHALHAHFSQNFDSRYKFTFRAVWLQQAVTMVVPENVESDIKSN
jgi:hypothetical protein